MLSISLAQDDRSPHRTQAGRQAGKTIISSRPIERLGKNKDGTYRRTSDNADAFFVIE
jgi:hypothetical protein